MPRTYTPGLDALTEGRTFRRSTLWKIEREDGTEFHFTDHDLEIEFEGDTYTPAGGFNASARQQENEFKAQNLEIIGMISSGVITEKDLRDGRYRNAKLTEYLVDWKHPWVGALVTNVYWVRQTQHTGENWTAELEGMKRALQPPIGNVFTRNCRYELGDSQCNAPAVTEDPGTVESVNDARLEFVDSSITGTADFFTYGKVTWLTGANAGLVFDVKSSQPGVIVKLQLPTPNDIEVGDTYDITQGCDKLFDTCKTIFNNLVNHGGFPFIPGTDKLMQKPKARP